MSNKTRNYTLHILWILVFLSIPIFTSPDLGVNMFKVSGFKRNFSSYILLVIFFYLNYYLFIPRYYFPKRYFLYGSFVFFCYAMVVALPDFFFPMKFFGPPPGFEPGHFPGDHPPMGPPPDHFLGRPEGGSILQFLLALVLSIMLRIRNRLREANSEKLKAEVSYLKAQINPHFLFNTLNSLYALTIQKSDAAPDAVIRLSSMMRYVVTESAGDLVPLHKEINYISDYIDLQKLRIPDTSKLEYTVTGDPHGKRIAPLVVIPFIENAFKYGVNSEEDWHITINIEIGENDFILVVKNNKVNVNFPEEHLSEQGIYNTQKRLEFIYPGQHTLTIKDVPETFEVNLKINWS